MSLAVASEQDLAGVVALEQQCFTAGERWSEQAWREEITGHDRHVVLAVAGRTETEPSGADAMPDGAATFQCVEDLADLHRIMVAPPRRGHGLAGQLLADGLGWARQQGADRMLLEVREDNQPAIALYLRHGFRTIARRANYYGAGAHALVMEARWPRENEEDDE